MQRAYDDRLLMSEAVEAVGRLLTAWPNGGAQAGKGYIGTLASVLCQYPRMIALRCADPERGASRKSEYLPSVATLVAWCEAEAQTMWQHVAAEQRAEQQFRDREAQSEQIPQDERDRVKRKFDELLAQFRQGQAKPEHQFTPEAVKTRLGLSDAEWNAIPDAPPSSTWGKATLCEAAE